MKILPQNLRNEIVEFYRTVFNWHDNEIKVFFFIPVKAFKRLFCRLRFIFILHTRVLRIRATVNSHRWLRTIRLLNAQAKPSCSFPLRVEIQTSLFSRSTIHLSRNQRVNAFFLFWNVQL